MKNRVGVVTVVFLAVICLTLTVSAQTASQPAQSSNSSAAPAGGATLPGSAPAAGAPAAAPRAPRFVPILVSATDGSGTPVSGLTKEQFSIMDTNQAVPPLQVFKDFPLHLGIVLLASSPTFAQQQAAAIDLVQKTIRPDVDEAFVVSAHGKKPWQGERLDWGRNPTDLTKAIQGLDRDAGLFDAFNFDMKTDEAGTDEDAGRSTLQTFGGGGVTVFDVVYSMMSSDPRPSRRVLVIFREPWSHSPGFGNRANAAVERQLSRVIGAAQEMHISTFVIGLDDPKFNGITDTNIGKNYISLHAGDDGGAGSGNREFDRQMQSERNHAYDAGKTNIQRIATETGGTTYWSKKKNYSDAVGSIANQLAGQYVVIFTPSDVAGPVHTLKVSSASGAHLLAQTSFFYGQ